jgi:fructokinase
MLGFKEMRELHLARRLVFDFDIDLVAVTRGAKESMVVTRVECNEHPGYVANVVDTIGAGDAYTAMLVHHLLRGSSIEVMNSEANRMGAWVASQAGATPNVDHDEFKRALVSLEPKPQVALPSNCESPSPG